MISKEVKAQLTAEYGKTPTDTGSPAVQVAILTYRIKDLTTFKGKPEGSSFKKRSS